ncbi:predicted protein [Botrytis cinerea T4]|uniref:Uncharacterized protein n=1 Tax=Botryotinia fuckeliana (strain T4) TaxID=999810 RepID=G2YRN0_BOTF4|nr:predicted protein [Botrytis cinerea T4]
MLCPHQTAISGLRSRWNITTMIPGLEFGLIMITHHSVPLHCHFHMLYNLYAAQQERCSWSTIVS